jgi:6-phosphogluconolactonase
MFIVNEYQDKNSLINKLATIIAKKLKVALNKKDIVSLALAGGTTPLPLFKALSFCDIEWNRVVVLPTDERLVAETDDRSNTGMIKRGLLRNFADSGKLISFVPTDNKRTTFLRDLSAKIKNIMPIDVCVLGMGEDFHIASIFPDADKLEEALSVESNEVVLPINSTSAGEARLTLTSLVLKSVLSRHLLIVGEQKRRALEVALSMQTEKEAPVRSILFDKSKTNIHYAR